MGLYIVLKTTTITTKCGFKIAGGLWEVKIYIGARK